MYIDDICSICPSCAFFAGNVCAAYQCELKDAIISGKLKLCLARMKASIALVVGLNKLRTLKQ